MTTTATACPFCGNDDPCIDEVEIHIHAVVCDECGCIGPIERYNEGTTQTAERAIELWNRRPREGLPAGIVEALNSGDGTYRP